MRSSKTVGQHGVSSVREALDTAALEALQVELTELRREMVERERHAAQALESVPPDSRGSARNLLHYTTLRRRDIRGLQARLSQTGLSSLGRAEPHVLVTLDRVLGVLALALGQRPEEPNDPPPVGFRQGEDLLIANARKLLGPGRPHRSVRIMVTLPSEAAGNPGLVREAVAAGMDCAR